MLTKAWPSPSRRECPCCGSRPRVSVTDPSANTPPPSVETRRPDHHAAMWPRTAAKRSFGSSPQIRLLGPRAPPLYHGGHGSVSLVVDLTDFLHSHHPHGLPTADANSRQLSECAA